MKKLVEILKELEKDKRPATAKQVSFVNKLLEERGLDSSIEGLTSPVASLLIELLMRTKPVKSPKIGYYLNAKLLRQIHGKFLLRQTDNIKAIKTAQSIVVLPELVSEEDALELINLMLEGKVEEAKQKANELCKKEKLYAEVVA